MARRKHSETDEAPASPHEQIVLKTMPEARTNEAALLGSMILLPTCIHSVTTRLRVVDFYDEAHRHIYRAIKALYEDVGAAQVNGLTVRTWLENHKLIETIGGLEYLRAVIETVPGGGAVEYYLKQVEDCAVRRHVIRIGGEMVNTALDLELTPSKVIATAEERLYRVALAQRTGDEPERVGDLMQGLMEELEAREAGVKSGLLTGFYALDDMTGGFQNGDMIIIAGRPSMGKTSFALDIVRHMALIDHRPVLIFSMEMSKHALCERLVCSEARVDSKHVREGMVNQEMMNRIIAAGSRYKDSTIIIDDRVSQRPHDLRSIARRYKEQDGIQAVVIDYVQEIEASEEKENRQQDMTKISRNVKAMARELNVPVIALSQLNRAAEARENNRPRLSDLRESGALEQDADVVIMMHRPSYYKLMRGEEVDDNEVNKAEALLLKQRNGTTGTVDLVFMKQYASFENCAMIEEPSPGTEFFGMRGGIAP